MIDVRVTYVHGSTLCNHNLAVRGYNPTREEVESSSALELLVDWCSLILWEFAIPNAGDKFGICFYRKEYHSQLLMIGNHC
jgi:hypothetical protein